MAISATANGGSVGLVNEDGYDITIEGVAGSSTPLGQGFDVTGATGSAVTLFEGVNDDATVGAEVTLSSPEPFILDAANATILSGTTSSLSSIADLNIGSMWAAQDALDIVDVARDSYVEQRSYLGAVRNRLEASLRILETDHESTVAARSRILDADYAREAADLARQQLMQQAGVAVLAQANLVAGAVLPLIQ